MGQRGSRAASPAPFKSSSTSPIRAQIAPDSAPQTQKDFANTPVPHVRITVADTHLPSQDAESAQDAMRTSRVYSRELSVYLGPYLANEPPNSRYAARQKLTRLTLRQFGELSTDVYDELTRRKKTDGDDDVPSFLPAQADFHPKRNEARQKLSTLPTSRFKDLSADVYHEIVRRYPWFKEEEEEEKPQRS